MSSSKITVNAAVAANPQKAWDYYTSPEHITKWNSPSDDWHCPRAENNMHVGGKYNARMEAKDGSMGFDFEAIYNEITPGKSFSYTMPDGRRVDATFEGNNGKTDVTVTFDPENQNPPEYQKSGWQAILDSFKKYAETN